MPRFLLKRLLIALLAVASASLIGFGYAHLARTGVGNPLFAGSRVAEPLLPAYAAWLRALFGGEAVQTVTYGNQFAGTVARAAVASLALLLPALLLSLLMGVLLGLAGVRRSPPGVRGWLLAVSTLGQATPSFFAGSLAIAGLLALIIWGPFDRVLLPVQGYGLDAHLILPALVLAVRPTAYMAQVVASLAAGELGRPYVRTAVAKGLTWEQATRRHALRNIQAPLAQTTARTLRTLVAELILVEWLFGWPGLGALLAGTLIPNRMLSSGVEAAFLDPPLVATIVTLLALFFVAMDTLAAILTRWLDPRTHG